MRDLLERGAELGALDDALDRARTGEGALVLVEGPAGIGKTRLLREAVAQAERSGMRVLRARGAELEHELPLAVVHQLLGRELADAGAERRARLLSGAAALAGSVFGLGAAPVGMDPAFAVVHGLHWLVVNLADEAPLCLAVDDVQWADDASLRWLAYLAGRLDGVRVVVVATARTGDGDEPPAIDALRGGTVLRPGGLSCESVEALVARELGAVPEPAFADACHEASGGNPFFLGELLAELRAEAVPPVAARAGEVHERSPERVARSVARRLDARGAEVRRLAQAVAVLGDGAPLRRAAALAGVAVPDALRALDDLAAAGLLAPGPPPVFLHPILLRATLATLAPGERAALHDRAAALLDAEHEPPEAVAVHLLAAEPAGRAGTVAVLRAAAAAALARGAPAPASACLRRALAEPPPAGERVAVLAELGRAASRAGEPDAVEHLREALGATAGAPEEADVALELGRALIGSGRLTEGMDELEARADALRDRDREGALLLEAELLGAAVLDSATAPRVMPRLQRLAAEGLAGDTPGERLVLANVASEQALAGRPAAETATAAERALAGGRLLAEQTADSTPFYLAVFTLIQGDRLDGAIGALDEALAFARDRGSALGFVFASTMRSHAVLHRGDVPEAEADAAAAAEGVRTLGWVLGLPFAYLIDALLERGALDEAEQALAASGVGEDVPDTMLFDPLLHSRARLRLARGDAAGAAADMAHGLAREVARGVRNVAATPYRSGLAEALLALGRREAALAHAEEEVALARAVGAPRPLARALRASAAADHERALERLEEALAVITGSPARLEEAAVRVALGAARRRAGARTAARDELARGRELAHRCGARVLAARAREELVVAGARPRRFAVSGVEALTAAERRVAELAAAGRSNREIAQALFLTTKTVETHLSRTYGKLAIASRAALPEALGMTAAAA